MHSPFNPPPLNQPKNKKKSSPKFWTTFFRSFFDAILDHKIFKNKSVIEYTYIRWKLQLGYFLINSLRAEARANLIRICAKKLNDSGVVVISTTCDGPPVNISTLRSLGATVDSDKILDTQVGLETDYPAYAIEDVCHMEKLIRNSWGTLKKIKNLQGQIVDWNFLVYLHDLQKREELHLGNRLTLAHLNWQDQKMKTCLAIQTISHRNAAAIDFARDVLKLPEFQGSGPTTEFMRMIDSAFDVMNSRSKVSHHNKKPMSPENEEKWRSVFLNSTQYICTLTDMQGRPLIRTAKKTGSLGFIVSMQSFTNI